MRILVFIEPSYSATPEKTPTMTTPNVTIATYTVDGWQSSREHVDFGSVADWAAKNKRLPLSTEQDVVRAVDAYLGIGQPGGPWHGKRHVERVDNWQWFAGWRPVERAAPRSDRTPPRELRRDESEGDE